MNRTINKLGLINFYRKFNNSRIYILFRYRWNIHTDHIMGSETNLNKYLKELYSYRLYCFAITELN